MSSYQNWILTENNHIATLSLNRAAKMNSLTAYTLQELKEISNYLGLQKNIWAVVLEGTGDNFSAGVDTSVIQSIVGVDKDSFTNNLRELQLCIDAFEAIPQIKIAKIKGYCIGGGLILACCCDFRIASHTAVFALPEVKLGIAVIMGTHRITRLAGLQNTKEMILLGEQFEAEKAKSYGLLNQLVSPEELDSTINQLADKFRYLPPQTISVANQIIEYGFNKNTRESQELEIKLQSELLGSADWQEAVLSHLQKRKPNFNNE